MKNKKLYLPALLAVCVMIAGSCGNAAQTAQSTQTAAETTTTAQEQTTESEVTTVPETEETTTTTTADEAPVFTGGYETAEKEFYRDGKKIAGKLFMPNGSGNFPAVILSHGFGANMSNVEGYAKAFADEGIAAYIFDFIGGGNDIQSDGEMKEMSVLTEAEDLNVVFDGVAALDGIDPDKMFLMGESQGGFVSSYVAATRPDDICGLVALYPAYSLQDDSWQRTPDINDIPETMNIMGKTLGRIYNYDAMSFDIYDMLPDYDGKVLLIHGTADNLVPLSYSERAAETFPDAELITIEKAGHGFGGKAFREAAQLAVDFVKGLI
ncbi:MAG: alpha/beta fold hydrolase [Ruminiclostridium sp.]|nr:alpha/beta fold hydrolase [Ruminiclostridium sp.]